MESESYAERTVNLDKMDMLPLLILSPRGGGSFNLTTHRVAMILFYHVYLLPVNVHCACAQIFTVLNKTQSILCSLL